MLIERDVGIETDDGLVLRADVFRPEEWQPVPAVMTLGPYGKGVRYQDGYTEQWEWLSGAHPQPARRVNAQLSRLGDGRPRGLGAVRPGGARRHPEQFVRRAVVSLQVLSVQHGNPQGADDPWLNERATGPEELSDEELAANRADPRDPKPPELDGPGHRDRSADWARIEVPFLSAANWGGFGLHARGNFEAFTQAASKHKWLEVHPGRHEEWFYLPYGTELQKRFFDHFLKGADNGWDREPPVQLNVRRAFSDQFELRKEHEWPPARTRWTRLYLDSAALTWTEPTETGGLSFEALGEGLTLFAPALEIETEITGPLAARLFISSSTSDADLFVTLRAFSLADAEVDFLGALDPHTPLAQGWLRASHAKLDPGQSRPERPYHPHDEKEPLLADSTYELDIEIWPTCIILPAGHRLALTIGGKDFARADPGDTPPMRGSGVWLHTDPDDRPPGAFDGTTTIHTGPGTPSHLLPPIIPAAA